MKPLSERERELAQQLKALEAIDKDPFRQRARLLQAVWRHEHGYDCGEYRGKLRGAVLPMPWAEDTLANYLTDTIKQVVKAEVKDAAKSQGKLYGRPRIYNNLLSSQPLCFNLFGELQQDLELASRLFRALLPQRVEQVTAIEFEHSPGRGDTTFTGDRSAFDVFVEAQNGHGQPVFVGIEVKYHENLKDAEAEHRARYDEVADAMGCFAPSARSRLQQRPLEQMWRDHLLAGALLQTGRYADGCFAFLYPQDNHFCSDAVLEYQHCLTDPTTFQPLTMESVVRALDTGGDELGWVAEFRERYLDFSRIDRAVQAAVADKD